MNQIRLKDRYTFDELVDIMRVLRSENGCPWDREQNHDTLRRYILEEAYELADAIDVADDAKMREELGDVLLQVVFHAQIAEETGSFTADDVISTICRKMILRHTHVFGDAKADTSDDVLKNWEEIKKGEKGLTSHTQNLMDVPAAMPGLLRSYKVQQRAAKAGFDWDRVEDAFAKISEETSELQEIYLDGDAARISDEIGDLLFAVVNVSRFLNIDPELAVQGTVSKFIRRFSYIEKNAEKSGKKLENMTLSEMDALWNEAKTHNLEKSDKNY